MVPRPFADELDIRKVLGASFIADLQEVLRLQSNFAQKQMQSYARQAQELGRLMAEATRSGEPKG